MRKNRRRSYVSNTQKEIELVDDDFYDCLNAFIAGLKLRDRSAYTIEYYDVKLRGFARVFEEMRLDTHLRAITGDLIVDEYIRYRREVSAVKHASIATELRALRAFFNWAVGKRIIKESPMDAVTIGTPKSPEVETFTRDQMYAILSQPDLDLFVGLRDFTIMTLLLDTGVRVRELCDIKVDDVRFEDAQILIDGKNGEYRLVPFQAQTRRILKRYIDARGESPVDWLFVSVDDEKMNRDSVRRRISKYGRMAAIDNVRCSPHTFRHTFAKMSVQNGANLFELQKILGHKSLDMVRVYVNLFSSDVKDAHARFSPVENLRIKS